MPDVGPLDRLVTMPDGVPDLTLGWEAIYWASRWLRHPNGPRAGQRWQFVDSQARFLLHWYALHPDGRWVYRHAARRLAKGSGKALALDTPLPTPTGWTTMGAVQVGDRLLDEHGSPCTVLAATEVMYQRPCYQLGFRDGTFVVADSEHLWPVREFRNSYHDRVVTTREIADAGVTFDRALTSGRTKASRGGVARWRTLPTPSLDLPEADLGIPAYLLGYWLGDGDSDCARLTVAKPDLPSLESVLRPMGVRLVGQKDHANGAARIGFNLGSYGSAQRALRSLGVLNDKHVPPTALRGSREQRMDLLRGLVDSDGSVSKDTGGVEITVTRRRLADGIVELARTLGLAPSVSESDARIAGRVVGRRWRVRFMAWSDDPVALLPRKAERLRGRGRPYAAVRTITDVQPVPSVPVRCITVSSPSRLFLAGEGMVPTHNSPMAAVVALIELCAPVRLDGFDPSLPGGVRGRPVDMPLVQIAATAESQTANTMRMVRALAPKGSRVVAEHGLDVGKTIFYKPGGGMLQTITSSATAAEGAECTFVVADEALALDTPLPTPTGWTMVGDVEVGDRLIGSAGTPVQVTYLTPVLTGRRCSRVTFSDGTSVVVDDGHLWTTRIVGSRAAPQTRTTRELAADGRRFSVPPMDPFDGAPVDAGIDPWVLGYWLGDGASRWASLTVGDEDVDFVLAEVRRRGVPAAKSLRYPGRAATVSLRGNRNGDLYTKDGSSVRAALVRLNVLRGKHVPSMFLRASLGQRLDLLRGLMDSDGWVGTNGSATFVNTNGTLSAGVAELARSVGYTTSLRQKSDGMWTVAFRPDTARNVFLLPRKRARVRPPSPRKWRTITSIEQAPSVPVRCIEVDADDHLFVVGDGWALTHNTEHWLPSNGGDDLLATLDRNLRKSGSRMMETANAWEPGVGSAAEATWDAWVAQEEGRTRGASRILYDARVAPPDTDLADGGSLTSALEHVYDDCWWVDVESIREGVWDPRTAPSVSRRFYLNQPVAADDAWCTPQQWSALADASVVVGDGDRVVLFFDGSKSRDATALVACRVEDGHVFTVGVWEPDPGDESSQVPVAEVDAAVEWAFQRWDVVAFFADVQEWEGFVKVTWPDRYRDRLSVWAVPGGRDPQPIAWDMRGRTFEFTKAAELALDEVVSGAFTHDGDSRLARHVVNLRRRPNKYGVSVGKESRLSPRKVDAGVCMIGARMARRVALAAGVTDRKTQRTGRVVGF